MYEKLKEEVCLANKMLLTKHLVILTWGNVSCIDREANVIAIKPSGVAYEALQMEDIVITDMLGNVIEGRYRPSSDLMTHLCLYKAFEDVKAIIHTHSKWATIWAQAERDLPVYGTTHADYFYGSIPCTKPMCSAQIEHDYEWNTGVQIVDTFHQRHLLTSAMQGVLVAGHGPFVWGDTPQQALEYAEVLETIAEMAYHCELLAHDAKTPLSKELLHRHYFRKHGKDAYYGQ